MATSNLAGSPQQDEDIVVQGGGGGRSSGVRGESRGVGVGVPQCRGGDTAV